FVARLQHGLLYRTTAAGDGLPIGVQQVKQKHYPGERACARVPDYPIQGDLALGSFRFELPDLDPGNVLRLASLLPERRK
ncbi:MAG: hypothetical protein MUQ30_15320, partial [Anaerolineae bacterium]|nr:hypothetical protein [Anaerolineae bacterium]